MNENETHIEELPVQASRTDIHKVIKNKVHRIDKEFTNAFEFINNYEKTVTFFGSARFKEDDEHYIKARELAKKVSNLGYTVLTGGGGGIMEAANRGAFEAGNASLGLNIRLPHEQMLNSYTTKSLQFDYFFVRKVAMSFAAEAYIFFPGGFGTLDELFEILTLVQTRKIRKIPIILVGADYWDDLNVFIKKNMLSKHKAIEESDLDLYLISDNDEEILEIIKAVPIKPMIHTKH
ncbi:MAG: TIGR00730 family Rossman fold protein [Candidatus Taylorbacteria bacterium]|nr:TIGR00730 family Rossman fold protein [Candidatus Taylorbacteria bacterium]